MCMPSLVFSGCCVSELYVHGHLCPYCNVWPELFIVVLQEIPNCLHFYMIRVSTSPSFVALHFLVSEIAKCIACAVYYCFTTTTLFTTMFTAIIVMYSLKSMCMPSFVFIGLCLSEVHGHLCPNCKVWPEAVYRCFTRITLFTELFTYLYDQRCRFISLHQVSLRLVSEIAKCIT